jgi:L-aminopeptidase/D-esterase-like protein
VANRSGDDTLTRVSGLAVGHATHAHLATGVTVIRFERAAPTVVHVLGGASATYDTASLALDATFGRRWAIFLSGGSLFGLDAARGVRSALLESGAGVRVFGHPQLLAPITGAALFDLPRGGARLPDYSLLGAVATRSATTNPVTGGAIGAGAGATVAKYRGRRFAQRGGLGSAATGVPGLGWVGVLAAVNSVGAVWDPLRSRWAAVARSRSGREFPPTSATRGGAPRGTTLLTVVCDATLERAELARIGSIASSGLARCVIPVFTATDGDLVFTASTEAVRPRTTDRRPGSMADAIGAAAAALVPRAIVRAVSAPERPAASD